MSEFRGELSDNYSLEHKNFLQILGDQPMNASEERNVENSGEYDHIDLG